MEFTPEKLKSAYNTAVEKKQTQFVFDGHDLLVDYAKYLIEYLTYQFN